MRFGRPIFLGVLLGLAGCVWVTLTQPRMQADHVPVSTPLPTASTEPTPTPITPVVAGKSTVKILLYGVSLEVTDPITDLVYGEVKDGTDTWAGFTTEKLLAKYPACKAGALGTLVRSKAAPTPTPSPSPSRSPSTSASVTPFPTKTPANQPFKKIVGGYTYSYRPSYFSCADGQAGRNELAAARAAVKNAALPTLSN